MVADGEAHLFVDVRLDELGRPVAVVAANEPGGRDVVEQAGEDDLLVYAVLLGEPRALHQVLGGTEAELEEVEQRRLVGHPRQARIVAHQVPLALVRRARDRLSRVALSRGVDDRLHDDLVQLLHHGALGCVRLLQCVHGAIIRPRTTTVKGGVRSHIHAFRGQWAGLLLSAGYLRRRETRRSRAEPQTARKVVRKACSLAGSTARGASAMAVARATW